MTPIGYKPGWKFRIGGPGNRYLCVFAMTPDSLAPQRQRCTQHMRELPPLQGADMARWVFGFLLDIERHEAAEFFQWDGERPFWPAHGDGDPYAPAERWDDGA